jgi:magnesium transporter
MPNQPDIWGTNRRDKDGALPVGSKEAAVLTPELVRACEQALKAGDTAQVLATVRSLHYSDVADLLQSLDEENRRALVEVIRPIISPELLPELEEIVREEVIGQLGPREVAEAITGLETDDAVGLVEDLEVAEQQELLEAVPEAIRSRIEEGLAYPEDSAGRLMQRDMVAVPDDWTVGKTIDHMREAEHLPRDFYDIYILDSDQRPVAKLPLSRLMRTKRPVPLSDIGESKFQIVPVAMDQEEVAFLFRNRDLISAPVVDGAGRMVGVITVDDIVDVIHDEAEEDIMRLGGVRETDIYRATLDTTRARFSWLFVNLGTAIAASVVIGFFQGTIEQIVALAVLMPIVASMGGNAGTQTMTVAVRALAVRELTAANALRIVGKEVIVGGLNGVLFAILTGFVTWGWFGDPRLGLVIGAAMIVNMFVAGLAGIVIPLIFDRTHVDPAVASSVVLTTITDVLGFFSFLGLATWFLL